MAEETGGEKVIPASPYKLQKARDKGNVAKSQDFNSAWVLAVALLALWMMGPYMMQALTEATRYYFAMAASLSVTRETTQHITMGALFHIVRVAMPFMLFMLAAGIIANIMQVGFMVAPQAMTPKLEKLNIFTGFGKFFKLRTLVELAKSLAKLSIISYIVYLTMRNRLDELFVLSQLTPLGMIYGVSSLVGLIWLRVVIVMLLIGLLDFGFQRWQHGEDLKMTTQEAREETKQLEGDPKVKQRVRQIQRQMAMQRMMAEVPTADVIITNPTTYAIALRYDMTDMDAPMVVAKGARLLASRIREIAVEHDVPIVEEPELARTIYRTVEVNDPVPESLYRAVAEVLRFVFEIDKRKDKQRERAAFMSGLTPAAG